MSVVRRIGETLRQQGVGAVCAKAFRRLRLFVYSTEHYLVFVRDVRESTPAERPGDRAVDAFGSVEELREARPEARDALAAIGAVPEHVAQGGMLFCVIQDGDAVHQSWVATKPAATVDRIAPFWRYDHSAYIGRCETVPAWRGRGLYPLVLGTICRALVARGITRAGLTVAPDNAASIAGVKKAGFRQVGEGTLVTCFGRVSWREKSDTE